MTDSVSGIEFGSVGRVLQRVVSIRDVARCPACGEPVSQLTNGSYACENGGRGERAPHIYHSRRQLDGDLKWWHGRVPMLFGVVVIGIYVLATALWQKVKQSI